MAEYIERQAAIEMLDEQIALCDKALKSFGISMKDEYAVKVEKASLAAYKEQLEALPSADVIPVVRCKDCEWAVKSTELSGWYMCKCEEAFDYYAKPDDFCSHGERREEEE